MTLTDGQPEILTTGQEEQSPLPPLWKVALITISGQLAANGLILFTAHLIITQVNHSPDWVSALITSFVTILLSLGALLFINVAGTLMLFACGLQRLFGSDRRHFDFSFI